jgi:release factor glutamine methyltransferase
MSRRLEPISPTPQLDAQVLLAHILGVERAWVVAHSELELKPEEVQDTQTAISRLESGEALPYVLGCWEFYGLKFEVSPAVLIPRPETELLVEQALLWLKANPERRSVLDVGAGSGCIAISLAVHIPDLVVIASDISMPALTVARRNAHKHKVSDRVCFVQADLLSPFARSHYPNRSIELICANPPYIPTDVLKELVVSKREPWGALHGGFDGLYIIRDLLRDAVHVLAERGAILVEIGADQGESVRELTQRAFPEVAVRVLPDLAGHDRLVVAAAPFSER